MESKTQKMKYSHPIEIGGIIVHWNKYKQSLIYCINMAIVAIIASFHAPIIHSLIYGFVIGSTTYFGFSYAKGKVCK
jgi:hypothetical protein